MTQKLTIPVFTITFAEGTIGDDMATLALPRYAFEAVVDRIRSDFNEAKEIGCRKVFVTARWGNDEALDLRLDINNVNPTRLPAILRQKIEAAQMMMGKGYTQYEPFVAVYQSLLAAITEG